MRNIMATGGEGEEEEAEAVEAERAATALLTADGLSSDLEAADCVVVRSPREDKKGDDRWLEVELRLLALPAEADDEDERLA